MANDFLPFCPTDTGSNLLSESDYLAAAGRTSGNQPGVASAKLNNKALRQGTYITSQVAQFLADITGTSVLDDAIPAKLLSQLKAAQQFFAPNLTKYTSSTGSWNATYAFMIATGNATIGATYTNNSITFTVIATVASAALVRMSGSGAPTTSGTLTKTSGTGDATLTFYAVRAPLYLRVKMAGGGGGGAGSGNAGSFHDGVAGNLSSFGTSLLVANGGGAGTANGGVPPAGGSASLGSGPVGLAVAGSGGGGGGYTLSTAVGMPGGSGGGSALGGGGAGGNGNGGSSSIGGNGATNSGGGGGAAGGPTSAGAQSGNGGGGGGYVEALILTPLSVYAYVVGASAAGGAAATSGQAGGSGAAGLILVEEHYQ